MNSQPTSKIPAATTPTNAAMSGGRRTFRRITSSGADRPMTAIMNASTVPSAAPLPRSASTTGTMPAALEYMGTPMATARGTDHQADLPMKLERFVEPWVFESLKRSATYESEKLGFNGRIAKGLESVRDVVGKVWPWVLAGIAVGAGIHGYVPEGLLAGIMGKQAWWSVPAAVAIGVPMYSNAAGIIPVVEALLGKGAALGTVLAFMMAVIGLSLPELVILRKVLRPRLIATFVGIVASGILMVGWLFNAVL